MASTGRGDNRSHDGTDAQVVESCRGQLDPRVVNGMHGMPSNRVPRFAATVFVRNLHPRHTVHLPCGPGWWRVLSPGATTIFNTSKNARQ